MDREAWWATVHGAAKASDMTEHMCKKIKTQGRFAAAQLERDCKHCLA